MWQAQARCHRIGQQKAVKVYRLITRNTYEREMFDRASLKLGLDKAVLQSMGPKDLNAVWTVAHVIHNDEVVCEAFNDVWLYFAQALIC